MMNETVQYERTQDVMPDFEELKKLTEDCIQGQVREQGITKIREIGSRQAKHNTECKKRSVAGDISRRWWRRMNLDETLRPPSHFTLRF